MAERFARGGRLVAFGGTPADRSDVRHVAVEFVHPVIVGKRALPAIGLGHEGGPLAIQVDLIAEPDDIAIAFGTPRTEIAAARGHRARAGLSHDRLLARGGRVAVRRLRADDPFVRQELVETLYHVLWELVHVFFEHRGLLDGTHRGDGPRRRGIELPVSVPGRARDRPRRGHRGRARLRADEGGGGRRAAPPDALPRRARTLQAAAATLRARVRAGRAAAGARQRGLGHGRHGRGRGLPHAAARLGGAARDRPHRGPGDPHRDRERHRRRRHLPAAGDRVRARRRRADRPFHQRRLAERDRGAGRGAPPRHAHDRAGRLRRRADRSRGAGRPRRGDTLAAHSPHPGGAGRRLPRAAGAGGEPE